MAPVGMESDAVPPATLAEPTTLDPTLNCTVPVGSLLLPVRATVATSVSVPPCTTGLGCTDKVVVVGHSTVTVVVVEDG